MTMATTTMNTPGAPASGRTLEELVDRLINSIFGTAPAAPEQSLTRSVHDARRLRQAGDIDGALALLAEVGTATAEPHQVRWAYAEWLDLARRRFGDREAVVYSPASGRAAVLAPHPGGALEVLAVLGMRWRPGKTVSRRSLRGLQPLAKGGS